MWVKICGVRDVPTALRVAAFSPQAIGLNFYERSPRWIDVAAAAEVVARLPPEIEPVGVFVNHSVAQIDAICRTCRLNTIQLHGDEPAEFAACLRPYRVIRAFRVLADGIDQIGEYLRECATHQISLAGCLVEPRVIDVYGGTGQTAPWDALKRNYNFSAWPPLILAGGLTPENVADAIRAVGPWGVDVASGVESAPGCKDDTKVLQFIENARRAFIVNAAQ